MFNKLFDINIVFWIKKINISWMDILIIKCKLFLFLVNQNTIERFNCNVNCC